jgi:hypothetical protein
MLFSIHNAIYCWTLKKTILFSGFKNPYKKSAKQENLNLSMNGILKNGKMIKRNQTKTLRRLDLMLRNLG